MSATVIIICVLLEFVNQRYQTVHSEKESNNRLAPSLADTALQSNSDYADPNSQENE